MLRITAVPRSFDVKSVLWLGGIARLVRRFAAWKLPEFNSRKYWSVLSRRPPCCWECLIAEDLRFRHASCHRPMGWCGCIAPAIGCQCPQSLSRVVPGLAAGSPAGPRQGPFPCQTVCRRAFFVPRQRRCFAHVIAIFPKRPHENMDEHPRLPGPLRRSIPRAPRKESGEVCSRFCILVR
jgi:hypothetical protein